MRISLSIVMRVQSQVSSVESSVESSVQIPSGSGVAGVTGVTRVPQVPGFNLKPCKARSKGVKSVP